MDVIRKLNEMRLERDMSVYRLSELSGINQSTLANTFSRGTVPSIANLDAMCRAMGVTLSQFFAEDSEPQRLSAEETAVINNYRKLAPDLKAAVSKLLELSARRI